MVATLHERALARRTGAAADAAGREQRAAAGAGGRATLGEAPSGSSLRRLAERRLALREAVVLDPSYRGAGPALDDLDGMAVLRAPASGGPLALLDALAPGRFDAVHLFCAGLPAVLVLCGEVIDPLGETPRNREALEALAALFAPGVETGPRGLALYGTSFATGAGGDARAQALADTLGVPVAVTIDRAERPADPLRWHAEARPRLTARSVRAPTSAPPVA